MRKTPTLAEKLAAALLELQRLRGDPIDRDHAKLMTADQICSLFQYDHAAGYACHGADNHPTMLTPLLIAEHREKTAKRDIPAIAKGKRIRRRHEEFRWRLLAKVGIPAEALTITADELKASMIEFKRKCMANGGNGTPALKGSWPPSQKIPSRKFSKIHRPLRSRASFKKWGKANADR